MLLKGYENLCQESVTGVGFTYEPCFKPATTSVKFPARNGQYTMCRRHSMVNLESVGTVIDPDGMTYPMLVDGGYDADAGTHVSDIEKDGDWMNNLSDADRSKLADLI